MGEIKKKSLDRYLLIGGIDNAYSQFASKKKTLGNLADSLDCSRETVRQNFISYFGITSYKNTVAKLKKPTTNPQKIIFSSINKFKSFLEKEGLATLTAEQQNGLLKLSSVISTNMPAAINISLISSNSLLIHIGDKRVCARIGIVHKSLRDYQTGFYRFKISKHSKQYDYTIFFIILEQHCLTYIFPTQKITFLKSLALRFKDPERITGKYHPYFNKWSVLNSNGVSK